MAAVLTCRDKTVRGEISRPIRKAMARRLEPQQATRSTRNTAAIENWSASATLRSGQRTHRSESALGVAGRAAAVDEGAQRRVGLHVPELVASDVQRGQLSDARGQRAANAVAGDIEPLEKGQRTETLRQRADQVVAA
eukprot:scaffold98927_cov60-Phaeocystis_antarctica.AAC.2